MNGVCFTRQILSRNTFFFFLCGIIIIINLSTTVAKYTTEKSKKPVDCEKCFKKTRPTCFTSFHKLIFPFGILFKFSYSALNLYTSNVLYKMIVLVQKFVVLFHYDVLHVWLYIQRGWWWRRTWNREKTLKDICGIYDVVQYLCDYFASLNI